MNLTKKDTAKTVAHSIDTELKKLVFVQKHRGKTVLEPNVCCACNRSIEYNNLEFVSTKQLRDSKKTTLKCNCENMPQLLLDCYIYKGLGARPWMKNNCLLSPRTCFDP